MSRVLDLQATYLDLVRPLVKTQSNQRRQPVANAAFASFEDGLVTRINLVVALGSYCGIGHPELTLACLKLLERMSSSSKIASIWSGSSRHAHRNKAIVAMEANGEHESIARSFVAELATPLESGRESESSNYVTKIYILDFLYQCLRENPRRPTIAHLLLGFRCSIDQLSVDASSTFSDRTSLFHSVLRILLETPSKDSQGMRQWLSAIKSRAMCILRILWLSPLSSSIVVEELRDNNFLFHLLIRETVINPDLPWEGQSIVSPDFALTDGAITLLDFLSLRSMTFEYIVMELCMISQGRMPSVKRNIFEALNGQITGDNDELIQTPTIFDLYDFLIPDGLWALQPPPLEFYKDLDLSVCVEDEANSNTAYNIDRARQVLLLKRNEAQNEGIVVPASELPNVDGEEAMIIEYLVASNRQRQIDAQSLTVLRTWARLLLVMIQCNDFKGTAQTSFFLQTLQAILPSLEAFASERPDKAMELATLTKILLRKLDIASPELADKNGKAIGHLVGEKLYQLFQICLQAIGKWAGTPGLRSVYYEICYWYLIGMANEGPLRSNQQKTLKTIHVHGERLVNVICDDACCGEPACQTSALILLNAFVTIGRQHGDSQLVESLNKLNFIGILVDSLRNVMQEWQEVFSSG